jgi:hypothetical protein
VLLSHRADGSTYTGYIRGSTATVRGNTERIFLVYDSCTSIGWRFHSPESVGHIPFTIIQIMPPSQFAGVATRASFFVISSHILPNIWVAQEDVSKSWNNELEEQKRK